MGLRLVPDRSKWTDDDRRFYDSIADPANDLPRLGPSIGDDPPIGKWGSRFVGTYAILQWAGCAVVIVIVLGAIIVAIVKWFTGH
jgi:hypothetical protein